MSDPRLPKVGLPGLGAPGHTPLPCVGGHGVGDTQLYPSAPGRVEGVRGQPSLAAWCQGGELGCSGVRQGVCVQRVRDSSTTRHRIPACSPSPWQPPGNQR